MFIRQTKSKNSFNQNGVSTFYLDMAFFFVDSNLLNISPKEMQPPLPLAKILIN